MATVSFRLRSKANKNVSIKIRISLNRENVFEISTGFYINPNDWSFDRGFPKQTNADNKQLHSNLKKLESFVWENLNADLANNTIIDQFWLDEKIVSCFNRIEKTDTGLVVHYLDDLINNADSRKVKQLGGFRRGLSKSRINSFIATKNTLIEYQSVIKKQIHFLDLSEVMIEKFNIWLSKSKKYAVNTSSKHLANIKTISREAERKGIQVNTHAKYIEICSEAPEERYIPTLSFDEQQLILNANISSQALDNARKWLLIGCEIGQRVEDLLNLTKDNIRYKDKLMIIDVFQQKTKKEVVVGVGAEHVISIIENEFPYKISDVKFNKYIKSVCEIAGINELTEGKIFDAITRRKVFGVYEKYKLITSHCCRRSFATNYYRNMQTSLLMKITGHSKESIFLKYINQREDQDINAELFVQKQKELFRHHENQLRVVRNGTND